MDSVFDTEFEMSVRCSGGMCRIDLSMKRDRYLGIISIGEAVEMINTDMIIYEICIE